MFANKRDFVFLQVSFALEDGTRAVLRHSITHPDVPEVHPSSDMLFLSHP